MFMEVWPICWISPGQHVQEQWFLCICFVNFPVNFELTSCYVMKEEDNIEFLSGWRYMDSIKTVKRIDNPNNITIAFLVLNHTRKSKTRRLNGMHATDENRMVCVYLG